jgi:hypothetical protein
MQILMLAVEEVSSQWQWSQKHTCILCDNRLQLTKLQECKVNKLVLHLFLLSDWLHLKSNLEACMSNIPWGTACETWASSFCFKCERNAGQIEEVKTLTVLARWLRTWGSIACRIKKLFFHRCVQTGSGVYLASCSVGFWGLLPWG